MISFLLILGNAKPPEILSQMIAEAREIRENQAYRSATSSCVVTSAEPKDPNYKVFYFFNYISKVNNNYLYLHNKLFRWMTLIVVQ